MCVCVCYFFLNDRVWRNYIMYGGGKNDFFFHRGHRKDWQSLMRRDDLLMRDECVGFFFDVVS